jgi:glycosyltransferase involved in cell wall biosynthesis
VSVRWRAGALLFIAGIINVEVRVLIVAENASFRFGGEASLPVHYYRILRDRSIPTWMIVHSRTRAELTALFPDDGEHIAYVADSAMHRMLWRFSRHLPRRLASFTVEFIMRLMTQATQRRLIKRMVREHRITVIHQPTPVSPKEPSMIFGMGVPVVFGPMNGGMEFPPAFRKLESAGERILLPVLRGLAGAMNALMPGKRRAAVLLVANERTRAALPRGNCARVLCLVENGVDLSLWQPADPAADSAVAETSPPRPTRFVFVGRLVDWKAVDLLLIAFKRACVDAPMSLAIIGDGSERAALEGLARDLDVMGNSDAEPGRVFFAGWMSQTDCVVQLRRRDALVLPSLYECGGAVVLEAMAIGLPAIATNWGGPADYLDPSCGILVTPSSREDFVEGLARALVRLALHPDERIAMGRAGRKKVVEQFDWNRKVDDVLAIYREAIRDTSPQRT